MEFLWAGPLLEASALSDAAPCCYLCCAACRRHQGRALSSPSRPVLLSLILFAFPSGSAFSIITMLLPLRFHHDTFL